MMRGYDPTGAVMYPSLMKDFVNLEFNLFLLLVRRALQALFKTRRSTSPMTSPLGCVCFHWSLQSLPTLLDDERLFPPRPGDAEDESH